MKIWRFGETKKNMKACDIHVISETILLQRSGSFKTHKEKIHEGARYPCDQCDYVATLPKTLKRHVINVMRLLHKLEVWQENKHEGVRYPCDQFDDIATLQKTLKIHKESKHEDLRYPYDQCDYIATADQILKIEDISKY